MYTHMHAHTTLGHKVKHRAIRRVTFYALGELCCLNIAQSLIPAQGRYRAMDSEAIGHYPIKTQRLATEAWSNLVRSGKTELADVRLPIRLILSKPLEHLWHTIVGRATIHSCVQRSATWTLAAFCHGTGLGMGPPRTSHIEGITVPESSRDMYNASHTLITRQLGRTIIYRNK